MKKQYTRSVEILLVEDNPGDVELVREALSDGNLHNRLHVASDGIEAMSFLRREGGDDERHPDLILLDLNLPRKSGREVLQDLKSDPDLQFIPVIILTSSKSHDDIFQTYSLHANCYVVKPVDFDQFMRVLHSIEDFWLNMAELPYKN